MLRLIIELDNQLHERYNICISVRIMQIMDR